MVAITRRAGATVNHTQDVRFKLTTRETNQWNADTDRIYAVLGCSPIKVTVLMAVHIFAAALEQVDQRTVARQIEEMDQ